MKDNSDWFKKQRHRCEKSVIGVKTNVIGVKNSIVGVKTLNVRNVKSELVVPKFQKQKSAYPWAKLKSLFEEKTCCF